MSAAALRELLENQSANAIHYGDSSLIESWQERVAERTQPH